MTKNGSPALEATLTPAQREAVYHRGGNMLVEAVPGSGKTRVIVARCTALLREGVPANEILVLTFSRKAVGELSARLHAEIGDSPKPEIRTFHGYAAHLLAGAGEAGASRRLLSEPAERALFANVVATTALHTLPKGVADSRLFRDAAQASVDDIRRAPDAAIRALSEGGTPRLKDLIALDATQKTTRERLDVADFDDLVARAVQLARTPGSAVAEALATRYRHVLVDEFQDTDPLQLALLGQLNAEIFAVGDAAQAIYGFRGAARDALGKARSELAMHVLPLAESFRCPPEVCELARSVWPATAPVPVALVSGKIEGGDITFRRAASMHDEAAYITREISAAIAGGIPQEKIAVLLRSAEPMATVLQNALRASGIRVTRQGGEKLLDDLAVDAIVATLCAFDAPHDPMSWVRLCSHPALGIDSLDVRFALRAQPPKNVDEAVTLLERHDGEMTSSNHLRLAAALRGAHEQWLADEPVRAARSFAANSGILDFVIGGDEDQGRLSASRITTLLDALSDVHDVCKKLAMAATSSATFRAFQTNSEAWRAGGEFFEQTSGVSILTVHAAKGLEFDFVVIADAVEGHFPQTWRPDTLVSSDDIDLARAMGVPLGTLSSEHDTEEQSLWYVAVTRSERRLLVTWSEADAEGSPLRPSRFIPLSARSIEAELPSFRGPLEYMLEPTLEPLQDLTPAHIVRPLRTSTMEKWFTCRRKFYYDALLKIGSEERGFNAKLGTLVHRAIAEFHETVRDFRNVAPNAHTAWATTLQELARAIVGATDFDAFDSPLEVEAAHRAANRLLDRYARSLVTTATAEDGAFEVIATEGRVAYEAGGLSFTGSIDRIDKRADGSLVLVDVKTGKLKDNGTMLEAFPKLEAAAAADAIWSKGVVPANPQLALYRHAKPETHTLSYLYLGSNSKSKTFVDKATDDRLDVTAGAAALDAIDKVLSETFFVPWTSAAVTWIEPTRVARTCRFCEFETVCPGYLEDED